MCVTKFIVIKLNRTELYLLQNRLFRNYFYLINQSLIMKQTEVYW